MNFIEFRTILNKILFTDIAIFYFYLNIAFNLCGTEAKWEHAFVASFSNWL